MASVDQVRGQEEREKLLHHPDIASTAAVPLDESERSLRAGMEGLGIDLAQNTSSSVLDSLVKTPVEPFDSAKNRADALLIKSRQLKARTVVHS